MTQNTHVHVRKKETDNPIITAVSIGGFLIVLGLVFALNPNLLGQIGDFFGNLTTRGFPTGSSGSQIALPAPANPATHLDLYHALIQFDIGIGVLQVLIIGLRLMFHSRLGKISETVGNLIFWFGAAVLTNIFLLTGTLEGWFQYWAALLVIVGVTVVVRGLIHLARR
ncbi:MAG: hypothetical protein NWF00_06035 [Candidatus Bathyarchaeota archaeon]|nr:hypothetical protein [Candidatus Bathyarchaeota archaeon]